MEKIPKPEDINKQISDLAIHPAKLSKMAFLKSEGKEDVIPTKLVRFIMNQMPEGYQKYNLRKLLDTRRKRYLEIKQAKPESLPEAINRFRKVNNLINQLLIIPSKEKGLKADKTNEDRTRLWFKLHKVEHKKGVNLELDKWLAELDKAYRDKDAFEEKYLKSNKVTKVDSVNKEIQPEYPNGIYKHIAEINSILSHVDRLLEAQQTPNDENTFFLEDSVLKDLSLKSLIIAQLIPQLNELRERQDSLYSALENKQNTPEQVEWIQRDLNSINYNIRLIWRKIQNEYNKINFESEPEEN